MTITPRHLQTAIDAVTKAMTVCRHVQASLDTLRAITKDDRSPVTIGDFAAQGVVASILREQLSTITLVGEESAGFLRDPQHATHLAACLAAIRDTDVWPGVSETALLDAIDLGAADPNPDGFWTLDPIDGTKGFLRGEQYCVCLAYIRNGQVELGVLGCPNLSHEPFATDAGPEEALRRRSGSDAAHPQEAGPEALRRSGSSGSLYYAVKGRGAKAQFDTEKATVEVDIKRPDFSPDKPARLAESVESSHTRHDINDRIMAAAGPTRPSLRIDSQCKYAVVARGDADVYLRVPTKREYSERIWDHAAGTLIAQEAGCTITDIRGKPLDFSRGRGLDANKGILGAPPNLHARLLKAIAQVIPE